MKSTNKHLYSQFVFLNISYFWRGSRRPNENRPGAKFGPRARVCGTLLIKYEYSKHVRRCRLASAHLCSARHMFIDAPSLSTRHQADYIRNLGASRDHREVVRMTLRCVDMLWSYTNPCLSYVQIATTILWF